jgi:hypothetical protein
MEALGADAQVMTVATASAKFTNAMEPGKRYRFTSTTACWVTVAATGGAAVVATANNHYCPADGTLILRNPAIDGATLAFVHAIRVSADGKASLSPIG